MKGEVNDLLTRRQIAMISVLSDFLEVNPKIQIFDLEPILGGVVRESEDL